VDLVTGTRRRNRPALRRSRVGPVILAAAGHIWPVRRAPEKLYVAAA
jgi:hypothetical protein